MRVQEMIERLQAIEEKYGNIAVRVDSVDYCTSLTKVESVDAEKTAYGDYVCDIWITEP